MASLEVPLRFVGALALFACVFAGALWLALRLKPRPFALALPLAWVLLVAWEGLTLPLLSLVHGVTAWGLAASHLPLAALGAWGAARSGRAWLARLSWALRPRLAFAALAPLAFVILLEALRYPPNSWDSMTYRLARVAHWLVERSVSVYPTWIPRQSFFPPGDEYLLLVPQVLTHSDRLAPLVQLAAWATLSLATPALARLFGAPRPLAWLAGVFVATLPMAALQASSTQNDLVAAIAAVAVVTLALSLAHRRRPGWRVGLALGAALAAAWLVKPTALALSGPFVLWAALAGGSGGLVARAVRLARSLAPALAAPLAVLGLEAVRRYPLGFPPLREIQPDYVYPMVGEWGDRLAHSIRALAHHLPISEWLATLSPALAPSQGMGLGQGPEPFRPSEGFAGNPAHLALALGAIGVGLFRWRRLPKRSRAAIAALGAGWVVLHALARENTWFSRLETPWFVLAVALFGVLARRGPPHPRLGLYARAAALPLLAAALLVVCHNEVRPLAPREGVGDDTYYPFRPEFEARDDAILAAARARGCPRLGVRLAGVPGDPWDYPLVWRAWQQGIEVRHVMGGETWPCLVVSPAGPPAPGWVPHTEWGLWVPAP